MSGAEPFLASLFAAAGSAGSAGAAGSAAASAAAASSGVVTGATAAGAAAAGSLSAIEIAKAAGSTAALVGTGAQLLAEKPSTPTQQRTATRDDAQAEANAQSDLYRRRGRASALLTKGGAQGDTSTPSLGSAQLLGA